MDASSLEAVASTNINDDDDGKDGVDIGDDSNQYKPKSNQSSKSNLLRHPMQPRVMTASHLFFLLFHTHPSCNKKKKTTTIINNNKDDEKDGIGIDDLKKSRTHERQERKTDVDTEIPEKAFTKGKKVTTVLKHLDQVLEYKAIIPFLKCTGGIGRKGTAKQVNAPGDKGRWPVKATTVYKDLLLNAVANAETKGQ